MSVPAGGTAQVGAELSARAGLGGLALELSFDPSQKVGSAQRWSLTIRAGTRGPPSALVGHS